MTTDWFLMGVNGVSVALIAYVTYREARIYLLRREIKKAAQNISKAQAAFNVAPNFLTWPLDAEALPDKVKTK